MESVITLLVICNHTMKNASQTENQSTCNTAGQSPLMLEITRGQTESPFRPIDCDRFLIGSGERCDLRLGGDDVPSIHSIIHIDGNEIWLEALAESPEVRVNGRLTRSAALEPGDALKIGSFCLTLHRMAAATEKAVTSPRLYGASVIELTEEEIAQSIDIEDLSARDLVDLIDREEALIEEFESRREMGAEALMEIIKHQSAPQETEDVPAVAAQPDSRQLLQELQAAIISLNEYAQGFEKRTEQLSRRDSQRAANALLDFQNQIVSRLDGVLGKIASLDKADEQQFRNRDVA